MVFGPVSATLRFLETQTILKEVRKTLYVHSPLARYRHGYGMGLDKIKPKPGEKRKENHRTNPVAIDCLVGGDSESAIKDAAQYAADRARLHGATQRERSSMRTPC
jgi:hypothetical protein